MSYPNSSLFNDNQRNDSMDSFFGLANRFMNEMLNRDGSSAGLSSLISRDGDSSNPHVKVFGVSSMNVTQISRGPDGRPRVVQAHDERRMGPGGVWQTKKALRDPDRGIDKMQVGYFVGDQGEIIERHFDPNTRQYREEVKRRGLPAEQWRIQAQQTMQRPSIQQQQQQLPPPPSSDPYQYY